MISIVSDKKTEYNEWMAETLDKLGDEDIKGISVSAICKNGDVLTGYWNLNLQDKAIIHTNIQYDCIDQMIYTNRDRYQKPMDESEDEDNAGT
jgi:hypothetical protein